MAARDVSTCHLPDLSLTPFATDSISPGTKIGCNRGECGACTVLIDSVPNYACSVLTHNVKTKQVTSIEGVKSEDGTLHAVQRRLSPRTRLSAASAPGQVMSAVALLANNPRPTKAEAAQAMSGNLCRCGAYGHYLNGVLRASGANSMSTYRIRLYAARRTRKSYGRNQICRGL